MTNFAIVIGRSRRKNPVVPPDPPPGSGNLAMPRGPVSGFAQAADFYDGIGIAHHPEYMPFEQIDSTIDQVQGFGLRHMRMGMYSPANHGAFDYYRNSGTIGVRIAARNASRGAGVQPISVLWGTTEEPKYEQSRSDQNRAVYTIGTSPSATGSTFTRPLDGPAGNVSTRPGPSWIDGFATNLENAGTYYNQGWITAGGLQGPNEPDQGGRTTYWDGIGGVRDTLARLKAAKNARTNVVLAGADYVDSVSGRIVSGPATAKQIPCVAVHLTGNNYHLLGDVSIVGPTVDCGCRHTYWGGHGPIWDELAGPGMWGGSPSYTGLPRFCTEMGQQVWFGPGFQFVPFDVAGVYNNRSIVINYLQGVRRTYVYKLTHQESGGNGTPYGILTASGAYTAAAHALKNLLTLVGFVQGPTSTPVSATISGFTPSANQILPAGALGPGKDIPDRLDKLILQRSATEFLLILARQRMIWDRNPQTRIVPDVKTVTLNFPSNTVSAEVAEPDKNPILDPVDGINYANPGNGTAYAPLTLNGSKQVTGFQVSALLRVVKFTIAP